MISGEVGEYKEKRMNCVWIRMNEKGTNDKVTANGGDNGRQIVVMLAEESGSIHF